MTSSRYTYSADWPDESLRLQGLEHTWDQGTAQILTDLGTGPGWSCLEVGAGAGSIARLLAGRVGPQGKVTAVDRDLSLLSAGPTLPSNVTAIQCDIALDGPPRGPYDLIHARLVLSHIPSRDQVLTELTEQLAAGGFMVIEDFNYPVRAPAHPDAGSADRATAYTLVLATVVAVMTSNGYDALYGARLGTELSVRGLLDVDTRTDTPTVQGGTPLAEFLRHTILQLRPSLLGSNPHITEQLLRQTTEALQDPTFQIAAPALVAAWGRSR